MEQIPTSSGGNATAAPSSSAGPSFTPPTPVQPSDDSDSIDKRLQSVFAEAGYQDEDYDEPDQMYLSGSSGSEEEISEVCIYYINFSHT